MKKLLTFLALALVGFGAKPAHAFSQFATVQISTSPTYAPTLQAGAINIASGTIQNFNTKYGVGAATGTFTGAVTIGGALAVSSNTVLPGATFYFNAPASISSFTVVTGTATSFNSSVSSITNLTAQNFTAVASTSTSFNATTSSITSIVNQNFTAVTSTSTRLNSTTIVVTTITPTGIVGTSTNDNANPSNYGFYISSVTAAATNTTTSNQIGDFVNISIPAGDWDVSALCYWTRNGSTWQEVQCGISPNSGNTTSGMTLGDSYFSLDYASTTTTLIILPLSIPPVRVSLSATTTYYLKGQAVYSGGPPQMQGRISARRVR